MNEVKLSKRLETVVSYVPKNARVADIGSDHAYLPCYAVLNNLAISAIAGEVVDGPFQSACHQVKKCELEDKVSVRKGSGLAVLERGEVDAITIAGMGGTLIRDILEAGKDKLEGVKRLILQPNIGASNIRQWFLENGWELTVESIVEEDKKIYEILVGERGQVERPYSVKKETELYIGPFLMQEKNDVFIQKWTNELRNVERIYALLEGASDSVETAEKKKEMSRKIEMIKDVLS